jgi:hypothetical protein
MFLEIPDLGIEALSGRTVNAGVDGRLCAISKPVVIESHQTAPRVKARPPLVCAQQFEGLDGEMSFACEQ